MSTFGARIRRRHAAPLTTVLGLTVASLTASASAEERPLFERDIRSIFRTHCFDCHGATDDLQGGLDLRLVRFMVQGGESGPAIVAGKPSESYLVERLRSGEMPPGDKRVSAAEIAVIEKWIALGAPTARPEPESLATGLRITPEDRAFWSFQSIQRPPVPELSSFPPEARIRTEIDALIFAAMPEGLSFSPDADRRTLIRRAFLDLIGLPPSPDELKKWLDEPSADWFDQMLTELLDSPHYGERWGRHWLDVVGYADSEGYTVSDAVRPWAWKYRDWVIRSLNADLPFDQFLSHQLAGDELAGPRNGDLTEEQIALLSATGFLRMAADGTGSGADNPDGRNQVMIDSLKIVGSSLLGLSVQCAQCHDHRYDPIPQRDYYALRAIFEPALDWQAWKTPNSRRVSLYTAADRAKAAEVEKEAQEIQKRRNKTLDEFITTELEKQLLRVKDESLREPLRVAYRTSGKDRTEEQNKLLATYPFVRQLSPGSLYLYDQGKADKLKAIDKEIGDVRGKKPAEEFLRALIEPDGHVPETKLFYRGDHKQPKDAVAPAALTITANEGERQTFASTDESLPTTGRRLAFAKWLTNGRHPLLGRVIANRIWLHHFGRGIVATPADFGKLGTKPTHPELLDWLADEFVQRGWSLKQIHRLILQSTVWRQSGRVADDDPRGGVDPSNVFYWRKPIVRLEAETLRDRMLHAAGKLDRTLFGSPLAVKEDETGQIVVNGDQTRRSLYIQVRRSRPVAMLQSFDAPTMETNCELRPSSTVAPQSLMLMNGQFILKQAHELASRVEREVKTASEEDAKIAEGFAARPDSNWQFGYGRFDEESGVAYTKLPYWTGSAWQGGPKLPDPKLGWVTLHATGGHPGNANHAAIRRWVAPTAGTLTIRGSIGRPSDNADGVQGTVVHNLKTVVGRWTVPTGSAETNCEAITVNKGDTIDFVTDPRSNETSDSFSWEVTLKLATEGKEQEFASSRGFAGPTASPALLVAQSRQAWRLALLREPTTEELRAVKAFMVEQLAFLDREPDGVPKGRTAVKQSLTNLCQILMSSNEFLYSD